MSVRIANVPPLEGWDTIGKAAEKLHVTKQMAHKMLANGKFTTARSVGDKGWYIIRTSEVDAMVKTREQAQAADAPADEPAVAAAG